MKTQQLYFNNSNTITIGKQGEYGVQSFILDTAPLIKTYGAGRAEFLFQPPYLTEAYIVPIAKQGNLYTWKISSADTLKAGEGVLEIRWYPTDGLAKSKLFVIKIDGNVLNVGSEAPEEVDDWITRATELIENIPLTVGASLDEYLATHDGVVLTTDQFVKINNAINKSHSHTNKSLIDNITASDIYNWNQKADKSELFSGNYNDLTNKPIVTNGIDGINGVDGADGKSAYEIAVENGFTGTTSEWLVSLKGSDGSVDYSLVYLKEDTYSRNEIDEKINERQSTTTESEVISDIMDTGIFSDILSLGNTVYTDDNGKVMVIING